MNRRYRALAALVALLPSAPSSDARVTHRASQVAILPLASRIFHNTRSIRVYLPPGYDSGDSMRRYPVLYFNDGFSVFAPRGWNAPHTLDSLITAKVIPPMIVVGIDNAASIAGVPDPERARADEFLPFPDPTEPDLTSPHGASYPSFIVDEVMPLIARSFPVLGGPEHTGIGGSSYGGIAALTTVLRRPDVFGTLLLESTPLFLFDGRLVDESRTLTAWPAAIYVGVGTRETVDSRIAASGQAALERFVRVAQERAPRSRTRLTVIEGATHTSSAWRARLPGALTFLYGSSDR
jgi:predicted alpha/beta superfamily hydrolase